MLSGVDRRTQLVAFTRSLTLPPMPRRSGREPVSLPRRVEGMAPHDPEATDTGWGGRQ